MRYPQPLLLVLFLAFFISTLVHGNPSGRKKYGYIKMMTITGNVLEQDSELPVNTTLKIEVDGFNTIKTATDKEGNFKIEIPSAEEFRIVVEAPGYEPMESTIQSHVYEEITSDKIEIKLTPYIKTTLNGNILAEDTQTPIDVHFNIYKFSDFMIESSKNIRDGKLNQAITDFGWYMIDLSAPGYQDVTDTIWVLNCKRKVVHKDYFLSPIEEGFTMKLNEIHFDFGKASITNDSDPELEKVITFLKNNSTLEVEISGHTDNEGPADYNLFLSRLRAQAVVNYLIENGIEKHQLTARGYGETKPIETNETYVGRSKNRRVELVVLKE